MIKLGQITKYREDKIMFFYKSQGRPKAISVLKNISFYQISKKEDRTI